MRRFLFALSIAGAVAAASPPLGAQQLPLPVIGVLSSGAPSLRTGEQFKALDQGLAEGGLVDGKTAKIEYRWASNNFERLPALAAELVRRRVDVIVAAGGHVSALAAHEATKDIPIVFTTVTDPVKSGLVASLNKPGGNATGTAGLTSELDAKRLELLREFKPSAKVFGVLVNPRRPELEVQLQDLREASKKMQVRLEIHPVASERDIDLLLTRLEQQRVDALLVTADPFFNSYRQKITDLAAKLGVPSIYQWREFTAVGGLMSYGPSITEAYRHAGVYAGRIVNGEKPANLPVVQPTRFEMVINIKTAKSLGIAVPLSLFARADTVID